MVEKMRVISIAFVFLLLSFSCENETHDSSDTFNDEIADAEIDNENPDDNDENLTKSDLSGCLINEGTDIYPVPVKVILNEKSENKISFYYQDKFYCAGNDFYYQVTADKNDETLIHVYLKAVNIMDGSIPGCDCPMRVGVEFSSADLDFTKIEKVEIEYDFYWDENREKKVFPFEKMNCFYKGKIYEDGDLLTDWCNNCGCSKYGEVTCDEMECSVCEESESIKYYCDNEKEIEWCECLDAEKGWECIEDPIALCEEE